MERDTDLTFREIHGNEHELTSYMEHIRTHALYKAPDDHEPLRLRLLVPCDPPPDASQNTVYLRLIKADESDGTFPLPRYITVSYTWNRSDAEEDIPEYRIARGSDHGNAESIHWDIPRCPPIVLHRAMRYAEEMVRIYSSLLQKPYIWIDQECIDQSDPEDVQGHLGIMDRIYRRSFRTVAILSNVIPGTILDVLASIPRIPKRKTPEVHLTDILKMLRCLEDDPWFGRTWTYHEQQCASTFRFLAFVDVESAASRKMPIGLFNGRYLHVRGSKLARKIEVLCLSVFAVKEDNADSSIQKLAHDIERMFGNILSTGYDNGGRGPRPEAIPGLLCANFQDIEQRENSVVSDRLAIFANNLRLPFRLKTILLETLDYPGSKSLEETKLHSYSTCLLVLLIANTSHKSVEISALQLSRIMDRKILDVVFDLEDELGALMGTRASVFADRKSSLWCTLRLDDWEDHPAIQR